MSDTRDEQAPGEAAQSLARAALAISDALDQGRYRAARDVGRPAPEGVDSEALALAGGMTARAVADRHAEGQAESVQDLASTPNVDERAAAAGPAHAHQADAAAEAATAARAQASVHNLRPRGH